MSPLRRVTFVRHAMPEVDAALRPGSWRLSDEGATAATALTLKAADAVIVSSPERKARDTVALALAAPAQIATDVTFTPLNVHRQDSGVRPGVGSSFVRSSR